MKKLILTFLLIIFCMDSAAAKEHFGSCALGFVQSKIIGVIISRQAAKVTNGKIYTKVQSYNAEMLRSGIFKYAEFNGKNLNINGIQITEINAKTVTDNNQLDITDKKNPRLLTDMLLEYQAVLTNEDLKTMLAAKEYERELKQINKKLAPFIKIDNTEIFTSSGKLNFKIFLTSKLFDGEMVICVSSDICSENSKTKLRNLETGHGTNLHLYIISLLDNLNPINITVKKLDNAKIKVSVKDINIINDKIHISGMIMIYKDLQ